MTIQKHTERHSGTPNGLPVQKDTEQPKLSLEQGIVMYHEIKRAMYIRENMDVELMNETIRGNLQILDTLEATIGHQDRCVGKLRSELEANFTQDELIHIYWVT